MKLIIATTQGNVIGDNNTLPFKLKTDLMLFKQKTIGNTVIMGRKTAESLAKPLKDRTNIILSRNPSYKKEGFITVNSLKETEKYVKGDAFIIGGAEIYRLALECGFVDEIHFTLIMDNWSIKGDTVFEIDEYLRNFDMIGATDYQKGQGDDYNFAIFVYKNIHCI